MKYKVGDKVVVKSKEVIQTLEAMGCHFSGYDMSDLKKSFCGREVTIRHVGYDFYKVKEDALCLSWTDEMFEDAPEKLQRGDIVLVRDAEEEPEKERVFVAYSGNPKFPFISQMPSAFAEDHHNMCAWRYATKKQPKKKLSRQELVKFLELHGMEFEV